MNNLSGVWSKVNETKLDPVFQNWAYSVASGSRPWQRGGE